jgi:choline dehydrogenase-like flavoprotein
LPRALLARRRLEANRAGTDRPAPTLSKIGEACIIFLYRRDALQLNKKATCSLDDFKISLAQPQVFTVTTLRRSACLDFDVLVVGAGLGGSFAALRLVERGLSVLVVELGASRSLPAAVPSWPAAVRRRLRRRTRAAAAERWSEAIWLAPRQRRPVGRSLRPFKAFLGCGPGGSSTIYSAALGRLRRRDFTGAAMPSRDADVEAPLPTAWPVAFETVGSYYAEAEAVMRIVGETDPLDDDDHAQAGPAPALSARDAAIHRRLAANGLHPFRLKVGFDYLADCGECPGRRCPRQCKADGYSRALWRALATGRARLETGTGAHTVAPVEGGLRVQCERADGAPAAWTARHVVVAAGALNTPLLLARSEGLWEKARRPAMLGRGLMFHVSDIFAVRVPGGLDRHGPKKTLALRDFYAAPEGGLGEVQSIGVDIEPGFVMSRLRSAARARRLPGLGTAVEFLRPLAWALARLLGPMPLFATITEDLPYASNRVWEAPPPVPPGQDPLRARGAIVLSYAPAPALRERAGRLRKLIRRAFAPLPVVFFTRPGTPNWGHPMGTCRMGADPATSVVTPDGHLWDHPNVFVADASIFPSSGGAGPSLTVAALALHVADRLADRCEIRAAAPSPAAPPRAASRR